MRLCLNMIVKDEEAILPRCLASIAPHITCWTIADTGSTDETRELIIDTFAKLDVPGELYRIPWSDFSQARNMALDLARQSPLVFDYLLFADADMELVVEDEAWLERLGEPGYLMLQRAGPRFTYWNVRLLRHDAPGYYVGPVHEYLDAPEGLTPLGSNAWFRDHFDGAARAGKYQRDIKLLLAAIEAEPDNPRHWFYLAQSYRDAGELAKAAMTYRHRAAMPGWEEENWYAQLQEARIRRRLGDEGGFVAGALAAFERRPWRREPLTDLARHYRERGMMLTSRLFAERGMALERREGDILFLEDCDDALREEYAAARETKH